MDEKKQAAAAQRFERAFESAVAAIPEKEGPAPVRPAVEAPETPVFGRYGQ